MEYIVQNEYLKKAIHKIDYKNDKTIEKVKSIELIANGYMLEKMKSNAFAEKEK